MLTAILASTLALIPPTDTDSLVAADKLKASVETLASFGTRHTLSDTVSDTRGIGAARRWLKAQFESFSPDLQVRLEEFEAPKSPRLPEGGRVVNVVAVLPGREPSCVNRAYYVVGHYDSRNGDGMDATGDAPGANDDASGTAVVLEAARVLASLPPELRPRSTIVFLCTAGEEQGLFGAKFHAEKIAADGPYFVLGVLSNDIVGDPVKPEGRGVVRVCSEGLPRNPGAERVAQIRAVSAESDSPSRQLARYIAEIAQLEHADATNPPAPLAAPKLVFRPDRFLRGGDHSAFNEAGFAGVRFTAPFEDYSRQHANVVAKPDASGKDTPYGDVPAFVDAEYLASVARLNVAALVHLANAPATPKDVRIVTSQLETSTTLRWSRSVDELAAGYEVVWRDTTSPTWTHAKDMGDATEATLPLLKDDLFFGVRAYAKDGEKSPVAFADAASK